MNVIDLLWTTATVGFVGLIAGLAAIGSRMSLDSRAAAVARTDPGMASALRQAQAVSDYAYGLAAYMPEVLIVCTPSRRAALSNDDDYVRPIATPKPELPAHAEVVSAHAHLAPTRRVYLLSTARRRGELRTGPATRARRADSRRRTRRRESRER